MCVDFSLDAECYRNSKIFTVAIYYDFTSLCYTETHNSSSNPVFLLYMYMEGHTVSHGLCSHQYGCCHWTEPFMIIRWPVQSTWVTYLVCRKYWTMDMSISTMTFLYGYISITQDIVGLLKWTAEVFAPKTICIMLSSKIYLPNPA